MPGTPSGDLFKQGWSSVPGSRGKEVRAGAQQLGYSLDGPGAVEEYVPGRRIAEPGSHVAGSQRQTFHAYPN
jgi:hypothetical protein